MSHRRQLRELRTIIAAKNAIKNRVIAEDLGEQYVQDYVMKQTAPITNAIVENN